MAAGPCATRKDSIETVQSDNYDPALDFFSDKFDPLKALNTPGLKPPVDDACVHDNIAIYESSRKQESADSRKKKKEQVPAETFVRKWLPHQLPVPGKKKAERNILTRMETVKGPLKFLKKCIDESLEIKVWTRSAAGIRGYCTGHITVFDKHWNLCLQEVTEIWTRKKKQKVPVFGSAEPKTIPSRYPFKIPEITIIKSDKKTETCQRFVPQLVIRGEQIALISVVDIR